MDKKGPRRREKNVTEREGSIYKREENKGQGPVGSGGVFEDKGQSQKPSQSQTTSGSGSQDNSSLLFAALNQLANSGNSTSGSNYSAPSGGSNYSSGGSNYNSGSNGKRSGRSRLGCLLIIVAIVLVLIFLYWMSKSNSSTDNPGGNTPTTPVSPSTGTTTVATVTNAIAQGSGYSSGWSSEENTGVLNTSVANSARDKYTTIKGNGNDEVTIMVYMCGTDLESRAAMATRDLQEMLAATLADNVHVIIYTGGCTNWQNDVMSNSVNQIYELVPGGKIRVLESNLGNLSMVDPSTLTSFIKYAAALYPSNRMDLIFWDHGGGSVSGYGYDQRFPRDGAMSLSQIDQALKNANVKFDFVGFDACLMATAETGLMLAKHADYMIASEETEPGIGWYYTNWLTELSANTSIATVDTGKRICDDFTTTCARSCPGQDTTLSVVDLAELAAVLPSKLAAFSVDTNKLIEEGSYKTVATARSSCHEFSRDARIDQIDLIHFAALMGNQSGKELVSAIRSAVKYNRTSGNTSNAYGLAIYFPFRALNYVDTMTSVYNDIGIAPQYSTCIKHFAQMQVSGQSASGGSSSPFWTLSTGSGSGSYSGGSTGSSYGYGTWGGSDTGSNMSEDMISLLIQALLSGTMSDSDYEALGLSGLGKSNTAFLSDDPLDVRAVTSYVANNLFDAADLGWKTASDGTAYIPLSLEQWDKIRSIDMAMYLDDGEGYYELGLDNLYYIDDAGNFIADTDGTWLAIGGQPVAYYHMSTTEFGNDQYAIIGRVPVLYNGSPANLIVVFDSGNPKGYIAGVKYGYDFDSAVAKIQEGLNSGDTIDFVCDYYSHDGIFMANYVIGDRYVVSDPASILISNVDITPDGKPIVIYKFTDIYGESYWTPALY